MSNRLHRELLACALAAGLGLPAAAQTPFEAIEYLNGHDTNATLGVGPDRVVLTTFDYWQLRDKSNSPPIVTVGLAPLDPIPFESAVENGQLWNSRCEWDPTSERFWIVMSSSYLVQSFPLPRDWAGFLHIAVSKTSSPDSFTADDWWFFTDTDAIDVNDQTAFGTDRFIGFPRHPAFWLDADNLYITATDWDETPAAERSALVIVPIEHTGGSMLDGDRPDDGEITIIQLEDLDPPDNSVYHYAVQESSGDNAAGTQFFIATEENPRETVASAQENLRIGGAFFDSVAGEWDYQHALLSLTAPTSGEDFFNHNGHTPATPDTGSWGPALTSGTGVESAVLWEDVNTGDQFLLATHAVRRDVSGIDDVVTVRWYVIDPDLANFPGTSWAPEVVTVGHIVFDSDKEGYHPSIAVNALGQAIITLTMSSSGDWPQLWHARLSSDFTAVDSAGVSQLGPEAPYTGPGSSVQWAEYADVQADPTSCGFWNHDTLLEPDASSSGSDVRQTYLIHYNISCGGDADFNGDSTVDAGDLTDFLSAYDTKDTSADLDANELINPIDTIIFMDAWYREIE